MFAGVAQLVERLTCNQEVKSSILFTSFIFLSLIYIYTFIGNKKILK